ncbi:GNAT family N-acetyltransferase [Jidongwangia harbinensis]|uniref:GNAT family N-acetyltransferase n=1 Tax=Jidongwangia harbinensis TaxID=2878561 RepID=UPI001CD9A411|nr:GNAT family N-acetyltransferase [Jidongwangia harbinensis]MCA2212274.1 GNAT family N-acetyltransferase [Jidongwangia harbinensis]
MQPSIRPYRPADLDAIYDICARTADSGSDARGKYLDDRLPGDVFAAPYVTLEPQHAHLLDDGTGTPVGYILGTADTAGFTRRYRAEWIPAIAGRYPEPADPPVTADDVMLGLHLYPERMLVPELADYPAHLHIDLLPDWQGKGWGRGLMDAFLAGVRKAGAARVHLGMAPSNTGALAFYRRLGFTEIPMSNPNVLYLGRTTEPTR